MSNELQPTGKSMGTRFTEKVIVELSGSTGSTIQVTDSQKRLAQNYFIAIDNMLTATETKRQRNPKQKDDTPYTWANVNMESLARNVVACAKMSLDPMQPNQLFMIPYKNNHSGKYDINMMLGYRGIELRAMKYGLDIPLEVIIEIVYSKDKFKLLKRDRINDKDDYEFTVDNPFDRGDIIGGFYVVTTERLRRIRVFTLKDILKRKPKYASAEFWGGAKDIWRDGKKVGQEQIEGWQEEMVYKTLVRAAYSDVTIDSTKIDDDFIALRQNEVEAEQAIVTLEIEENANTINLDIESDAKQLQEPATVVNALPGDSFFSPEEMNQPDATDARRKPNF